MKVNKGEILGLDDNKEYICLDTMDDNNIEYLYLMGNFKPATVRFAKVFLDKEEDDELEIIYNEEEKQKVFKLFRDKSFEEIKKDEK